MKHLARSVLLGAVLMLPAGSAGAVGIGVEGFGGVSLPIVQDDSDQGTQFGIRIPVKVPMVTLEPYFASSSLGDVTQTFNGLSYERDGGKVTAFGLNARVFGVSGPGLGFFPYIGIGSHTLKRDAVSDRTEVGYNLGLGVGFSPVPKFGLGFRGEFNAIVTDETSRKFVNLTLSVSYDLISLP